MNKEILKLTYEYIDNNKSVDKQYIIDIINIITTEYNITNMINQIHFPTNRTTYYQHSKRVLGINYRDILKLYLRDINLLDKSLSNFDKILLHFYITIEVIFHELEHVLQWKKVDKSGQFFEDFLIKLSFINANRQYQHQYYYKEFKYGIYQEYRKKDNFYLLTPTERMANINSTNKLIHLTSDNEEVNNYFINRNTLYTTHGYRIENNDIISPLEQYLTKRNYIAKQCHFRLNDQINKETLNYITNCSLQKRLLYGLPISKEEFRKIK